MLDAHPSHLTALGEIVISDVEITIDGFSAHDATGRDVAALAIVWAIGKLQVELMKTLERPGGGIACVN